MSSPTTAYTKTNLGTVKDSAPQFGHGDVQEARFATGDLHAEDVGVSLHRLHPSARGAFAHRHDQAEEVYVVLRGSGRVKLDDDVVELAVLDAVRVPPQVTRQFEAGPHGMEWLAFGARREGDGEILQDWWTD